MVTQSPTPSFGDLKNKMGLSSGTWYEIKSKEDGNKWFLPVCGDQNPSFQFTNNYQPGDDMGRALLDTLAGQAAGTVSKVGKLVLQKTGSGTGIQASICALYNDSAPAAITVSTKIIGGSGDVIQSIEEFRTRCVAKLSTGFGGSVAAAGFITIPDIFDVKIITGQDSTVIATFLNMACISFSAEPFSPYLSNGDPVMTSLNLQFQGILPGFKESAFLGA